MATLVATPIDNCCCHPADPNAPIPTSGGAKRWHTSRLTVGHTIQQGMNMKNTIKKVFSALLLAGLAFGAMGAKGCDSDCVEIECGTPGFPDCKCS